jgi:hypothetical protein
MGTRHGDDSDLTRKTTPPPLAKATAVASILATVTVRYPSRRVTGARARPVCGLFARARKRACVRARHERCEC